jgi:hypothetical protein
MWIRSVHRLVTVGATLIGLFALTQPLTAAKPDNKKTQATAAKAPAAAATMTGMPGCCGVCCPCAAAPSAKQASASIPPSAPTASVTPAKPTPPAVARQPATRPTAGPGRGMGMMRGRGMGAGAGMGGRGMGPGAGMGGPGNMREVMGVFHQLLTDHAQIQRTVQEVDDGVVTVTTSKNPVVTALIRTHAAQMKTRLEKGQPVRRWDPLFVEIFKHADKIDLKIDEVAGGVRVTETSEDPQVVPLIRQHAQTVSQFVARGWDRAHEATPLPEGYPTAKPAAAAKGNGVK